MEWMLLLGVQIEYKPQIESIFIRIQSDGYMAEAVDIHTQRERYKKIYFHINIDMYTTNVRHSYIGIYKIQRMDTHHNHHMYSNELNTYKHQKPFTVFLSSFDISVPEQNPCSRFIDKNSIIETSSCPLPILMEKQKVSNDQQKKKNSITHINKI